MSDGMAKATGVALEQNMKRVREQEAELASLREKLAAAGAEKDAVLAGEATWIRKAAEYNDKMRAERAARVQAEADLTAERQARERAEARVKQLEDMYECVHCTQTARNEVRAERAEAALSRARELLKRFVRLLPRSLDMGRLPFAALHDEAAAFVAADPANTPKELATPVPADPATKEPTR